MAGGQDIYAVTAPLVAEATCRILAAPDRPSGVVTAGALTDARDFLTSPHPRDLTVDIAEGLPEVALPAGLSEPRPYLP